MKLTIFLLTAAFLNVQARSYSQEVTFSGKEVPLQKVFSAIENQTGYVFFYNSRLLKMAKPVTLDVRHKPLIEVLTACMQGQPLDYAIENTTIVITPRMAPTPENEADKIPPVTITGTIVDGAGQPLAGATITVKESGQKALTDNTGHFSIMARVGNTLIVSYIGHETKTIRITGTQSISITLLPMVRVMDEVSVSASTGYQNISKERATGSYDVVGPEILSKRPASNLSSMLEGIVPGLQAKENVDGSASFLIRGTSSLYAGSAPLVVVDGFPITGSDFSNINPNDVESVTVLKDAAAASIWGARSANGVIVITTKQPKMGRNRMNVEVNAFTRMASLLNTDQVLVQASSPDQVKYERMAWDNQWFFNQYAGSFTDIGKPLTLAQELLFANKNGKITTDQMNKGLDSLAGISNKQQVNDYLLRHAMLSQVNLTLSTATERSKTVASVMFENNKDGFVKNGYNRYVMNFNNQYVATRFLTLTLGAMVQYKKTETSGATVSELQALSPYETLLNPDGKYSVNLNTYNREQQALLPLNLFPYSDWSYNLLREVNNRRLTNEDLSARIQAGINIKLFRFLNFDSKLQYERRKLDNSNYYNDETFYVRNIVNTMVDYNNSTRVVGNQYIPKGGILQSGNTNQESYVFRNQLNYSQRFGSRHEVTVIAGNELSQYRTTTLTNPWSYGYYPDKLQSTVPQYGYGSSVDQFKNFMGTVSTISGSTPVYGWGLDKYVSFYGNAAYTYNGKYTLSGSARSDASNFITDDPKLRWAPLWSVGAMWNLKKEDFMKDMHAVNRLNLRLTYGRNGNAEKSTSQKTLISVSSTVSATTGTITASIADNGNPYLRWEKTATTDLGIDFALFNNKLNGKVDLYNKQGSDIIGIVALPAATGTTSQKFNNAGITNRGIELQIGTSLQIPGTPVYWNTSLTYAYNWNRVNKLYYPSNYAYAMLDQTNPVFIEGKPASAVYSFTYLGMVGGIPQVAGPKGALQTMNDASLYNRGLGAQFLNYEGTYIPPHTLGWVNDFKVLDFDLMVLLTGTFGNVYRDPTFNYANASIGSFKTFVNRFVSDVYAGDPNIPGFANPKETQLYLWDRYVPYLHGLVESASYIQCKEIDLGYELPSKIAKAIQMNSLRVFAQARDLGMIWHANSKGYNPDWLPGTNRPLTTWLFGINFQF